MILYTFFLSIRFFLQEYHDILFGIRDFFQTPFLRIQFFKKSDIVYFHMISKSDIGFFLFAPSSNPNPLFQVFSSYSKREKLFLNIELNRLKHHTNFMSFFLALAEYNFPRNLNKRKPLGKRILHTVNLRPPFPRFEFFLNI